MPSRRTSAAYRIAFAYAAAFALGIAILGTIIFYAMHASIVRELDGNLSQKSSALLEEYRNGGLAELAEAIDRRESIGGRELNRFAVFDPTGRRLYGNLPESAAHLGLRDTDIVDSQGKPDVGRSLGVSLGQGMRLVVATDLEPVERADRMVIVIFGVGFCAVIMLGGGAAMVLGGYLRRRLEALSTSAARIVAGDILHRMPVSDRNDEFDRLAETLNAMLGRIESLLENLRQISGDVAHDLRTPLTRLRTQLEAGGNALVIEGTERSVIARAIEQVDEILALFSAILRISEVESGQIAQRFTRVDLSELVTDIAESYAPAIEDNQRRLEWSVEPGIVLAMDRELIAQALINLIENAQRHTPAEVTIVIRLKRVAKRVELQVADNGPGVAEADWPRLTKRFVRLDRSRSAPGHGLGLNLVRAVTDLHGGLLAFSHNHPGLAVTMLFPSAEAQSKQGRVRALESE